jgi:hypothetical protein
MTTGNIPLIVVGKLQNFLSCVLALLFCAKAFLL